VTAWSPPYRAIIGLTVLALGLRLWIAFGSGATWYNTDSLEYLRMADAIRARQPYSSFPNGYPLMLAAAETLLPAAWVVPGMIGANAIMSAAVAGVIGVLGVRVFTPAVGVTAAALVAVWPNQINYARQLLSESAATLLIAGAIYLLIRRRDTFSGLAAYAAVLMRSSLLPVVPLMMLWIWTGERRTRLAGFALGIGLLAAADAALVGGGVLARSTHQQINLWLAPQPSSDGVRNYSYQQFSQRELDSPVNTYLEHAIQQPGSFLLLRLQSLWDLWGPWPDPGGIGQRRSLPARAIIGARFIVLALAVAALWLPYRRREAWLIATPVLAITAVHAMFYSSPRYTVTAEPFVLLLTARLLADRDSPLHISLKRVFDVVTSGLGLVVFSPVAACIAIAIKLEDGGPVLFVQERVGMD
jgi:hypothetical protein